MNRALPCLMAILCLGASFLPAPAALAASGGQTPTCYVNRYGVEKCGTDGNNGGDKILAAAAVDSTAASVKSGAPTRLQRYCAEQQKAGRNDADGLCAQQMQASQTH